MEWMDDNVMIAEIITWISLILGIILIGIYLFTLAVRGFEKKMLPYLILGIILIITGLIPT